MYKIARTQMNIITYAVNEYAKKNLRYVSIDDITPIFETEPIQVYGIDWSSIGTQDIEATIKFADSLKKAAEIVKVLNNLQLVVDWDMKCSIDKIEDKEIRKSTFWKEVENLKELIEDGLFEESIVALGCLRNKGIRKVD